MFTTLTPQLLIILKHELHLGILYPFAISFVCMMVFSFFSFGKRLRWIGGLFGGLFAIISMLKFINFGDPRTYSVYLTRHDKMIYLIILACLLSLFISLLSLTTNSMSALKTLSCILAIAFVGCCVYWYEILKIENVHFDYIQLISVTVAGIFLYCLLIYDGFHKDVSSAIGLLALCIVYGLLFYKMNMPTYANTIFALGGVVISYILVNYFIFSSRFSLTLGFMLGGMLISIMTNKILSHVPIDPVALYAPLILLFVSPICRFVLNIIISSKNTVYKYILPILTLILSIVAGGAITVSLIFLM